MPELPDLSAYEGVLVLLSAALLIVGLASFAKAKLAEGLEPSACHRHRPFVLLAFDNSWRDFSFVASLFLHLVLLTAFPVVQLAFPRQIEFELRDHKVTLLQYGLPEVALQAPSSAAGGGSRRKGPESTRPASRRTPQPERAVNVPATRVLKVVLPAVVPSNPSLRDVIARPDSEMEMPPDLQSDVPPVISWVPEPLDLVDASLVEPGAGEIARWEMPDYLPGLKPPQAEAPLANLKASDPPVINDSPALPFRASNVFPLQGRRPPPEPADQFPTLGNGEPSRALIALQRRIRGLAPAFRLHEGHRLGSIEGGDGLEAGPSSEDEQAGSAAGTGNSIGQESSAGAREAAGDPAASGFGDERTGEQNAVDATLKAEAGSSGGATDAPAQTGAGEPQRAGAAPNTDAASGKQQGPRPAGGVPRPSEPQGSSASKSPLKPLPREQYGIILVSDSRSAPPEVAGLLTGNPVYTVYLDVPEAPRNWTLQFCIPQSSSKDRLEFRGNVVRIVPRKRVDPPFAQTKTALRIHASPAEMAQWPRRALVYALVDAEGMLGDLRVVSGADPETNEIILANLRSWEFLPAFQDGEPIAVEAVFGIPLR